MPGSIYSEKISFEDCFRSFSDYVHQALTLRREVFRSGEKPITQSTFKAKVESLTDALEGVREAEKAMTISLNHMQNRFKGEEEQKCIERSKAASSQLLVQIDEGLCGQFLSLLRHSLKDVDDDSLFRLLALEKSSKRLVSDSQLVAVLIEFVQGRGESAAREADTPRSAPSSSLMERYKSVLRKLKKSPDVLSRFIEAFSQYIHGFEFFLKMEKCDAIPVEYLQSDSMGNAENYSLDHRGAVASGFLPPILNSTTLALNRAPAFESEMPGLLKAKKTDAEEKSSLLVSLGPLKSKLALKDFSAFSRTANLILSQIFEKTQTSIEFYSLLDVIRQNFLEFISLLNLPQVKSHLKENRRTRKVVMKSLSFVLSKICRRLIGFLNSENEAFLFASISSLFALDKRLCVVLMDKADSTYVSGLVVNCCFAFTAKKFINHVTSRAQPIFDAYIKNNSSAFKKLDIYNAELGKLLAEYPKAMKEAAFFQKYNEFLGTGGFFEQSVREEHYMTPFHQIMFRVERGSAGAAIWVVKVLLFELMRSLCSKKKYIGFLGYLSLMLNLNAFIKQVSGMFDKSEKPLAGIGEIRVFKRFFHKLVYAELTKGEVKKPSAISASTSRIVGYGHDHDDKCESFSFTSFEITKASPFEMPAGFSLKLYFEQVEINSMVN